MADPTGTPLLALRDLRLSGAPFPQPLSLDILPGLSAVTGDEGTGKTTLLRLLASELPPDSGTRTAVDGLWLDLRLPQHDQHTPVEVWAQLQSRCPRWNEGLQGELARALDLAAHLDKRLYMLSTGSRRKVGLVALLASGSTVTCIDQPYASLDLASVQVLRECLQDMADHPYRAWVVADYEADASLPWRRVITLD